MTVGGVRISPDGSIEVFAGGAPYAQANTFDAINSVDAVFGTHENERDREFRKDAERKRQR